MVLLLASGALDLKLLGSGVDGLGEEEFASFVVAVLLPLLDSSFFFSSFDPTDSGAFDCITYIKSTFNNAEPVSARAHTHIYMEFHCYIKLINYLINYVYA